MILNMLYISIASEIAHTYRPLCTDSNYIYFLRNKILFSIFYLFLFDVY